MTIVARKDFEPNTLQELVAYVKANTDKVTLANAGIGAASQLCGLLFEQAIGVDLTEVPYDGTGPALTDLVGGQVDFMCDQTTNTAGQIQSGEIKGYAVTTPGAGRGACRTCRPRPKRVCPDVQVGVWHGLYVPAGTPDEVVDEAHRGPAGGPRGPDRHRQDCRPRHHPGRPRTRRPRSAHTVKLAGADRRCGRRSSRPPGSRRG